MPITYQQTTDKGIIDQVRNKHWLDINELKLLKFEEFCFFGETVKALGFSPLGLKGFLGILIALFKEVTRVESNLNVHVYNVVLASREYATYAAPFGLGVKLYTSFTDGTCIISATFETPAINDKQEKIYKFAAPRSVEATWKHHQAWVDKLIMEGKQKADDLSFANFLQMSQKEDNYMLKNKNTTAGGALGPTVLSVIIFMGLLMGIVYLWLVLGSLLQALYPSCLIVSDKTPFLQMVLITLGCFGVSWGLARIQKDLYLIDGMGTRLFGNLPLPDAQGYISTKWLTFIFLPLLPVRSYHVTREQSNMPDGSSYTLKPLERINWAQVKETMWQSRLWYVVMTIALIGLITLPVWKCIS